MIGHHVARWVKGKSHGFTFGHKHVPGCISAKPKPKPKRKGQGNEEGKEEKERDNF